MKYLVAWLAALTVTMGWFALELHGQRATTDSARLAKVEELAQGNNSVIGMWISKPPWRDDLRSHAGAINWCIAQVDSLAGRVREP